MTFPTPAQGADWLSMLVRREVITMDPAEANECCGIERDEDGFCKHRPHHPIYIKADAS